MLSLDSTDTITAIASPPGAGFRGIIRLSGPEAWPIALTEFTQSGSDRAPTRGGRHEGRLRVNGLSSELPAAIFLWSAPKTYTGQPLAEIHTVGSPPLVQLVLAETLGRGARLAEPGEFTLRAFLSGRIDLTRAEAVLGVIDAASPAQLDAALKQLAGGLFGPVAGLRDRLLDVLAHLEANLDFVDEADVAALGRVELAQSLSAGAEDLAALAEQLRARDRPDGLPRVVLAGPPNAGKSRLFNALLGHESALVSPVPGTTRDYLAAHCDCDGLTLELVDTAGDEPASSAIEARAQSLRADLTARADLVLECVPADSDVGLFPSTSQRSALRVLTKCDLLDEADAIPRLATSAATGEGLEALRLAIAAALRASLSEGDYPVSTGARCRESLRAASAALARASKALSVGLGDELVSVDLRLAIDELGKVVGAVVTDDILDRIFRRFCIGK